MTTKLCLGTLGPNRGSQTMVRVPHVVREVFPGGTLARNQTKYQ